jgi:hypothetical protein
MIAIARLIPVIAVLPVAFGNGSMGIGTARAEDKRAEENCLGAPNTLAPQGTIGTTARTTSNKGSVGICGQQVQQFKNRRHRNSPKQVSPREGQRQIPRPTSQGGLPPNTSNEERLQHGRW